MKRPTFTYLAINFVCMLLFLFFVLRIEQRISSEQRVYSDFGDHLDFLVTAVPMLALSIIFSVAWGIASVIEAVRQRTYQKLMALGLVAASWSGLVFVLRRLS
jgi:heme/copper-type cytochrome/quinol oxidase subunit 2